MDVKIFLFWGACALLFLVGGAIDYGLLTSILDIRNDVHKLQRLPANEWSYKALEQKAPCLPPPMATPTPAAVKP